MRIYRFPTRLILSTKKEYATIAFFIIICLLLDDNVRNLVATICPFWSIRLG